MPMCIVSDFDDECEAKAKNGPLLMAIIILNSPQPALGSGVLYLC